MAIFFKKYTAVKLLYVTAMLSYYIVKLHGHRDTEVEEEFDASDDGHPASRFGNHGSVYEDQTPTNRDPTHGHLLLENADHFSQWMSLSGRDPCNVLQLFSSLMTASKMKQDDCITIQTFSLLRKSIDYSPNSRGMEVVYDIVIPPQLGDLTMLDVTLLQTVYTNAQAPFLSLRAVLSYDDNTEVVLAFGDFSPGRQRVDKCYIGLKGNLGKPLSDMEHPTLKVSLQCKSNYFNRGICQEISFNTPDMLSTLAGNCNHSFPK